MGDHKQEEFSGIWASDTLGCGEGSSFLSPLSASLSGPVHQTKGRLTRGKATEAYKLGHHTYPEMSNSKWGLELGVCIPNLGERDREKEISPFLEKGHDFGER